MSYLGTGADPEITWYGSKDTTAPASMQRKSESTWNKVSGKFLTGLDLAVKMKGLQTASTAAPSSGSSPWLLPVALGGGALLLVVLLAGKK